MFRVTIVGRPNVGKSSLFNRLTRRRRAIVGDQPGITRDRLYGVVESDGKRFELVDTGGILPDEKEGIPAQILAQAVAALRESDLVLFVVDARQGVTPLDRQLNALLRTHGCELFLVVNKVDAPTVEAEVLPFHSLGVEALFPVSAEHKLGIDDLMDAVLERVPPAPGDDGGSTEEIGVAVIGRPNVGKSSLLNRVLGEERVIVSPEPGTTRDSVDTLLKWEGHTIRLIDTAGIRRKGKTRPAAEKLSVVMARKSIERSDVVLLVVDAAEGATRLDATVGGYAHRAGRSVILVVNKWDLIQKETLTSARFEKEIRGKMRFLDYAPMVFVSALTGLRVRRLLSLAAEAWKARRIRIPTGELNDFFEKAVSPGLLASGTRGKFPLKYVSQVSVAPPRFVLFARGAGKLHFSTQRYIVNRIRERYGFFAAPIELVVRGGPGRRRGRKPLS